MKQGQKYRDKNAYGLAENGPGLVEALKISASICVICGQFKPDEPGWTPMNL
jgi:hypothetical protein